MTDRRSYRQYCGLAKALDVVGERWTLLIIRNLLIGPQRYSDLLARLPGITTNLLAKRLAENPRVILKVLGHADIKTTMRYAHLERRSVSARARDVIERLSS